MNEDRCAFCDGERWVEWEATGENGDICAELRPCPDCNGTNHPFEPERQRLIEEARAE
jgi:hypothetical protein